MSDMCNWKPRVKPGDHVVIDGSWWRCTGTTGFAEGWVSVDPPKFVRKKYRTVDAIRKLKQEG